MALIPAASEQYLSNAAVNQRLAVIIDLLGGGAGIAPSAVENYSIGGVPFSSADASAADAPITSAPAAGQKINFDTLVISSAAAINLTFKEETSATVMLGPIYMAANSTVTINLPKGKALPTADKRLTVRASAAGAITISTAYRSQP